MPNIKEKHIENNETTNTLTHDTIITPDIKKLTPTFTPSVSDPIPVV